jgi:tight adherence protein B
MGVGAVWFWVSNKAKKRLDMIEEQLPDAIDLIVRALRVGHPFSLALAGAAKEIPDPLGSELGLIADEAAYGRDMGEALMAFGQRMDMQDLRFLAVAVSIQQKSGGNLAEILDGLSKVIRARFKLFRRVRPSPPRRNGRACSCRAFRSSRCWGSASSSRTTTTT